MNKLEIIKETLINEQSDAWILVDYECKNQTLVSFIGKMMLTRKLLMVFPLGNKPYIICHSIDAVFLNKPEITDRFVLKIYNTWQEMLEIEKSEFSNYKTVLMDFSENGLLPRVSLADYGSVQFVKDLGISIKSSANILQKFNALYSERAFFLQKEANKKNLAIKDEAFMKIKTDILERGYSNEYSIQQFICRRYAEENMVFDEAPIVAIGKNASNPHYGPTENVSSPIKEGDLVLIDMWAKMNDPEGVYSDITWMGYVGKEIPNIYADRFNILKTAIEESYKFLESNLPLRSVQGYEVDDVSRKIIKGAGYEKYFIHRTGHNIAIDVSPHGPGVNIDNYESHDTRDIIDGVSFSLEPGIYTPEFGMRSETNVYIENRKPILIGGHQEEIVAILK